jgi:beta-RFAP synthase
MVAEPRVRLRAVSADRFAATGPCAARVTQFAQRWCEFHGREALPACSIDVLQVPPEHTGLGVGTQLGLSVATALNAFTELSQPTPLELATSVGRGLRSAVGTYGFFMGGLIAERGKLPHEAVSPLDVRVELPSAWRFVLVRPQHIGGLHGMPEVQAFSQLPPVTREVSERLISLAREQLVPAAVHADFPTFSSALYDYCHLAGECFSPVQGGAYNGPVLQELVALILSLGVRGIGQSSWGPTLFCLLPNQLDAEACVAQLRTKLTADCELLITPADNHGVAVRAGTEAR